MDQCVGRATGRKFKLRHYRRYANNLSCQMPLNRVLDIPVSETDTDTAFTAPFGR